MKANEIKEKITKVAEETVGVHLEEDEPLIESGVDSLALVTLVVAIEELFNIVFEDDDLQPENLRTLSDLMVMTEKYL